MKRQGNEHLLSNLSFYNGFCKGNEWQMMSLWRNRLARSAVNRKVGGSSPPRDVFFFSNENVFRFLLHASLKCDENLFFVIRCNYVRHIPLNA